MIAVWAARRIVPSHRDAIIEHFHPHVSVMKHGRSRIGAWALGSGRWGREESRVVPFRVRPRITSQRGFSNRIEGVDVPESMWTCHGQRMPHASISSSGDPADLPSARASHREPGPPDPRQTAAAWSTALWGTCVADGPHSRKAELRCRRIKDRGDTSCRGPIRDRQGFQRCPRPTRRDRQKIDVRCAAPDTILLGNYKAAKATERDSLELRIEVMQERAPRFGRHGVRQSRRVNWHRATAAL